MPRKQKESSILETVAENIGEAVGGAVGNIAEAVTSVVGGAESDDKAKAGEKKPAGELPEYLRRRRSEVGRVVSDKMEKSVVVSVERAKQHPIYKKVMRRSVKFMAHNELGAATGDLVRIVESRPMSKRKRWQVVEIVQRAEKI